jgi:hypothetical protein
MENYERENPSLRFLLKSGMVENVSIPSRPLLCVLFELIGSFICS